MAEKDEIMLVYDQENEGLAESLVETVAEACEGRNVNFVLCPSEEYSEDLNLMDTCFCLCILRPVNLDPASMIQLLHEARQKDVPRIILEKDTVEKQVEELRESQDEGRLFRKLFPQLADLIVRNVPLVS